METTGKLVNAINNEGMRYKYFTFLLDSQLYAIPIANVVQIIEVQPIIQLPDSPSHFLGMINVRGHTIPVIDIRAMLKIPAAKTGKNNSIVIISTNGKTAGFLADSVHEVTDIPPRKMMDTASNKGSEGANEYIAALSRHRRKTVIHLNLNKLLAEKSAI